MDGAQPFLKASYTLEGDGPLAFSVYDEIKQCENFIICLTYWRYVEIWEVIICQEHKST